MMYSISLTLLAAVVSCMLRDEITETGTEGNIAVITCPYGQGYESYTKYFCKGIYKDCVTLVQTNGKNPWTHRDRISMHDNTEQKKLVVTISDLRMEDGGNYGCGIEKIGQDCFTLVHLEVLKAPKRPESTQTKPNQSSPPPATKNNKSQAPTLSTNKTAVTNGTGSSEDRGNTTLPATHHPDSDTLLSVGGVVGGVLLAVAIISGIFFAVRCSAEKETAATSQSNSETNVEEARLYEEIQTTDAAQANGSVSTPQGRVPHSASDRCSSPPPACITVYSTITNQGLNSHSDDTRPAQHTHYAVTPIKGLHRVRVKAPLGGNASVRCPYDRGSELYPKYFSKGREKVTIVKVKSTTWSMEGRFSLEDDREKREFIVTIKNLSVDDAGLYWCGVNDWGPDTLTEVNLDVEPHSVSSTESSASLLTTSSPFASMRTGQSQLPQNMEESLTNQSAYLGGSLAAVVLLCGIMSAIFVMLKRKNAKRAKDPALPEISTESNRESFFYENIFPTNASSSASNPRLDSVLYDTPDPNQPLSIHRPHSILRPSARGQVAHPESGVYYLLSLPKAPPDDATLFTPAETTSLHYATANFVQSSHAVSESSAFSRTSRDIYANIQLRKDGDRMASVSNSETASDETRPL
ncbi:hypothetical protein AOLI_G00234270 [Acnodon oligacanthus]